MTNWSRKFLIFACIASAISLLSCTAICQNNEASKVRFDIRLYEVDLTTATATVDISLAFNNLYLENLQPDEPITAIVGGDGNYQRIECKGTIYDGFNGSSGNIIWALGGELGQGEYVPFEEYELTFQLLNVLPGPFNMSTIELERSYSFAFFDGAQQKLLGRVFTPLLRMSFPGNLKAVVHLSRKLGPFDVPTLFWPLIAPTLACYYLLAGTLFLRGKEATSNRLRAYMSLFFFGPTFFLAIQGYLPLRATLSIPEVLLENLMISTVIFTIFSLPKIQSNLLELTRDGIMLFISHLFSSFFFVRLIPVIPSSSVFVFGIAVLAYVLIALGIWNYYLAREISSYVGRRLNLVLGIIGIICIDYSVYISAWLFSAAFILGIFGVVTGAIGVFLIYTILHRQH